MNKSKTMKYFLIFSVLFCGIASAQKAPVGPTNKQLSTSITKIEKTIIALKKDFQKASKLLDNKAMLNMFESLDEVSQEVGELRGMIEEQAHLQERLQKRQRELYADIDRRLRELELKSTSSVTTQATTVAPIAVPSIGGNQVNPSSNNKGENTPVVVKPKDNTSNVQPSNQERLAYQKAFDLLKEGRYNNAKAAFNEFLTTFPNSPYAGNAQYWSGEANYVTRKFTIAMQEFKKVITDYPNSNKVSDAMLKLGYTFYETKQMDKAKEILNDLVKRFADSTAASLAKKRLERMLQEGV